MDGWTDGEMDERVIDGQMDAHTDEWLDEQTDA